MELNDATISSAPKQESEEARVLKKALELMKYYYNRKDLLIKMMNFDKVYSENEIKGDVDWVKLQMATEQKAEHGPKMLENIVADLGNKWFGENVSMILLSPYDDRKAHGDVVMEIKEGDEVIRILIDLTTTHDREKINEKMDISEQNIRVNKLSELKYFISKLGALKGKIGSLPRVVAGVDVGKVEDICKMIAGGDLQAEKSSVPTILLEEILFQLVYQKRLAKSDQIRKILEKAQGSIQELIIRKKSLPAQYNEWEVSSDSVYKNLEGVGSHMRT